MTMFTRLAALTLLALPLLAAAIPTVVPDCGCDGSGSGSGSGGSGSGWGGSSGGSGGGSGSGGSSGGSGSGGSGGSGSGGSGGSGSGGPGAPASGSGTTACCNSVVSANQAASAGLLGLLPIALANLGLPIGLTCSPITVVGVGSGDACSGTTVTCAQGVQNGVGIGCVPIVL